MKNCSRASRRPRDGISRRDGNLRNRSAIYNFPKVTHSSRLAQSNFARVIWKVRVAKRSREREFLFSLSNGFARTISGSRFERRSKSIRRGRVVACYRRGRTDSARRASEPSRRMDTVAIEYRLERCEEATETATRRKTLLGNGRGGSRIDRSRKNHRGQRIDRSYLRFRLIVSALSLSSTTKHDSSLEK